MRCLWLIPSTFYYKHRTENTGGFKSTDLPASTPRWPRESLNQGQPGRQLLYPSSFPSLCLLMSLFKYGIIAFPGLITMLNMNSSHLQGSQQPRLNITLDITLQQASSFFTTINTHSYHAPCYIPFVNLILSGYIFK